MEPLRFGDRKTFPLWASVKGGNGLPGHAGCGESKAEKWASLQHIESAVGSCYKLDMRHTIVEKLKRHFSHAPQTEGDVVYTIVEIRKLLEHSCAKERYATLTFFCDWAVHVELSRSRGGRKILQTLDEVLGRYDSKHTKNLDPDGKVFALVSLDLFNRQLNQFCKDADLPMDWTDDWRLWQKFVLLYA